jgi:hypothetical protein
MDSFVGRLGRALVVVTALSAVLSAPAGAALINYTVSFSAPTIAPVGDPPFADPFTPAGGPVQNLAGTFTLQFDDSADASGLLTTFDLTTTSGQTEANFGFMGFRYNDALDRLSLGNCDASGCDADIGNDNIIVTIFGATSGSAFVNSVSYSLDGAGLQYNAVDDPAPPFGQDNFITETISFAPVPSRIPEPASLALIAGALSAFCLARRRRAATPRPHAPF